ncbi:MAG: zinc ribbon domain-containing protein [Gammaproteobacteria bacterium]|nr:zinc ribbon domain-containing protein [Gammaproteobacteria bacterium]
MPIYDYTCASNEQTIEVMHRMNETLKTWGELCEKAGIEPGSTPRDTTVTRIISGVNVNTIMKPMELSSILPRD